ncbi:hypothetical protein SSX86_006128 [Deinandra increscens subsp. villosa]|uniref:Beta-lactamase-related domain-containing protein n=1 Tax=Deinandra increscens subsp. villosa TaxID=3103831 RepID=A0AAP0HCJ0_9ASTR
MDNEQASKAGWLYDNPVYSDVEAKLRRFLVELGNDDKILGIQVCAYKDGQVIIDTAAGVLGKHDPRPVQPDSLFPVFSVTKGVTAGMVNHILNHTSGLPNALFDVIEDHSAYCDWDGCLKRIAMATPETEPGREQLYHYLSNGWLCGGIIEHASRKKFQDVLEEAFVRPLNIEGELYIGIPSGVESRLATLTIDTDDLRQLDPEAHPEWTFVPSSLTLTMVSNLIALMNTLEGRCAIGPGAGGNFSARAVARYYAALVDGGVVPPPHPSSSLPPLGSHPHHPTFPPKGTPFTSKDKMETKIFNNSKEKLHDTFLGSGDYKNLVSLDGTFGLALGLGFSRFQTPDGSVIGFGHSGLGGSIAYCDINNRFAISVTLNKLSMGALTGEIIRFVCSELQLPVPLGYTKPSSNKKPVCAYKDGQVIIDTAAGVLGKDDPRPVQPDSLFPVFSVTKGVTAGMVHWLADKGKLKLDENVANIWSEFGTNGKDQIKINHILNHTSGLANALPNITEDRTSYCDWDGCLKHITMATPETEPGCKQLYHYLSYGWLCGGIIEHASGKKFQDILEEVFVRPLNVEGELYIGIPSGVEYRIATPTIDTDDLRQLDPKAHPDWTHIPSSLTLDLISNIITLVNVPEVQCAIQPAGGGYFSARALARYYAALVDGGEVPPPHPSSSLPPLGSHPHHPTSLPKETSITPKDKLETKIFNNAKMELHDAFLGSGDNMNLVLPNGSFGLGFSLIQTSDGFGIGFGHSGLGGSTAYCDINNMFAISVTLNKLSTGALTGEIIRFICSQLELPIPLAYTKPSTDKKPVIN